MSSRSTSTTQDNRLGFNDEAPNQLSMPQSQLTNPFSVALQSDGKMRADVTYGNITLNEYTPEVNQLVSNILASSEVSQKNFTDLTSNVIDSVDSAIGIIEGIKTPLAKYLPYAVLAIIVFFIWKYGK